MELKLDKDRVYALALEGGGAKGAYEIGFWQALQEAGIEFNAVSGTSVGALNGAMMALGDLEKAKELWLNIRYSQVMDVDDEAMRKMFQKDMKGDDWRSIASSLQEIMANKGFDVTPLRNLLEEAVDEDAVRASARELFIITYSISDRKELELRAKDLTEPGEIRDMLLERGINLELMKAGFPPIDIKFSDRAKYYAAFDAWHSGKKRDAMAILFATYLNQRREHYLEILW